jgi:hypothetical protein
MLRSLGLAAASATSAQLMKECGRFDDRRDCLFQWLQAPERDYACVVGYGGAIWLGPTDSVGSRRLSVKDSQLYSCYIGR